MTPEQWTEQLKHALDDNLVAVAMYGSAAAGEQTRDYSNINMCVVVRDANVAALKALSPVFRGWVKTGNPWPVLFRESGLLRACDVFPIEFADIQRSHRMMHGRDVFADLRVESAALRTQLEHELRVKLLRLRETYFEAAGRPDRLKETLARSFSSLAAIFRTVLRLVGEPAEALSLERLWARVAQRAPIDVAAFETVYGWRQRAPQTESASPEEIFGRILSSLESVTDFVDRLSVPSQEGGVES